LNSQGVIQIGGQSDDINNVAFLSLKDSLCYESLTEENKGRRKGTYVAQKDFLNETPPITVKVWLPGTHPGSHQAAMTLEHVVGLRYFLSTLVKALGGLSGKPFDMVAYKGQQPIGQAIYRVDLVPDIREPVQLTVIFEEGEIEGMVRQIWEELQREERRQVHGNLDENEGN
jgi:hypothetical protein